MSAPDAVAIDPSADAEGFASILRALLEQNLAADPGRRRFLRGRSSIAVVVPDAGVAATVRIFPGEVVVLAGADLRAAVSVTADATRLLETAAVPLRLGLPDPSEARGRAAVRDLLAGRVRIGGLARHPLVLRRFIGLLSVAGDGER